MNLFDLTNVTNEKVVKTFRNSKNQEYILTKGSYADCRRDKVLTVYKKDENKKNVRYYEQISSKQHANGRSDIIVWNNFKNDEQLTLIREKPRKKPWQIFHLKMKSNSFSVDFWRRQFKSPHKALKMTFNTSNEVVWENLSPKEKLVLKLLKKIK